MTDVEILRKLRSLVGGRRLLEKQVEPCLAYLYREIKRLADAPEQPKLDGPELLAERVGVLENLHGKAGKRIAALEEGQKCAIETQIAFSQKLEGLLIDLKLHSHHPVIGKASW